MLDVKEFCKDIRAGNIKTLNATKIELVEILCGKIKDLNITDKTSKYVSKDEVTGEIIIHTFEGGFKYNDIDRVLVFRILKGAIYDEFGGLHLYAISEEKANELLDNKITLDSVEESVKNDIIELAEAFCDNKYSVVKTDKVEKKVLEVTGEMLDDGKTKMSYLSSWGELAFAELGDYIIIEDENNDKIYTVTRNSFDKTYRISRSLKC
ncbi:MAG: hypothetical protein N4A47_03390 [Clostridia bacterium]|jgi:hypothetical protein|nr:hypothetical protein [Clostridia bacterium]